MKTTHVKSWFVLTALASAQAIAGQPTINQPVSSELVSPIAPLLSAYVYLSRFHAPSFQEQIGSQKIFTEFHSFDQALGKIGGDDLVNEMGFVDQEFTIPSRQPNFRIDLNRIRQSNKGQGSYAFVTTPVNRDGRSLVILSMQSPERVTIFWIDKYLRGELVYDSFRGNGHSPSFGGTAITSISSLQTAENGHLEIIENASNGEVPRYFMLSVLPTASIVEVKSRGASN